jgi:hypothetical protein
MLAEAGSISQPVVLVEEFRARLEVGVVYRVLCRNIYL